ncbi:MAG: hypothetical protein AAF399_00450 [Bacteroidota bacterium]
MNQRPQLYPNSHTSVSVRQGLFYLGGAILLLGFLGGIWWLNREAPPTAVVWEEFYFSPTEDNFFENPANWMPAYPGTHIPPQSRLIVQGVAYLTDYDLTVSGQLQIAMDGQLFSSKGSLILEERAQLANEGELILHRIENRGQLFNRAAASLNVHHYDAMPGAITRNFKGASFVVNQQLRNQGLFDNYGQCSVRLRFENEATFNQLNGSELMIQGEQIQACLAPACQERRELCLL